MAINYDARLVHLNINRTDFDTLYDKEIKWSFRILPASDSTYCKFWIAVRIDINKGSLEAMIEVMYVKESPDKRQPSLMDFIDMTQNAVPYINKVFNDEVVPKTGKSLQDIVKPPIQQTLTDMLSKECDRAYRSGSK